jgi:hypothetical protein
VFRLSPRAASARAGRPTILTLTWTTPGSWRKLSTIDLRFMNGKQLAGLVRLTEDGSETGRLSSSGSLVDPDLGAARVTISPDQRNVTLRLPVAFDRRLAGLTLGVDAGATEDAGLRQEPARAGTVRVLGQR